MADSVLEVLDADSLVTVEEVPYTLDVGERGPAGPPGAAGVGVPPGGLAGQVLVKLSAADYDTGWADAAVTPPPAAAPSLDFSQAGNSQYLPVF